MDASEDDAPAVQTWTAPVGPTALDALPLRYVRFSWAPLTACVLLNDVSWAPLRSAGLAVHAHAWNEPS
jgi:hypothetical protein